LSEERKQEILEAIDNKTFKCDYGLIKKHFADPANSFELNMSVENPNYPIIKALLANNIIPLPQYNEPNSEGKTLFEIFLTKNLNIIKHKTSDEEKISIMADVLKEADLVKCGIEKKNYSKKSIRFTNYV
jgi:hypothetical protein